MEPKCSIWHSTTSPFCKKETVVFYKSCVQWEDLQIIWDQYFSISGLHLWNYLEVDWRFPEDANTWRSASEKYVPRSQRDKPARSRDNRGQCSVVCPAGTPSWLSHREALCVLQMSAFYAHLKWGWSLRVLLLCISLTLSTLSRLRDGAASQPFISNLRPPPVTALLAPTWSLTFQPLDDTMLLLKNNIRHWFAYFLKSQMAASSKVSVKGY